LPEERMGYSCRSPVKRNFQCRLYTRTHKDRNNIKHDAREDNIGFVEPIELRSDEERGKHVRKIICSVD
jgi:hypothetical protein